MNVLDALTEVYEGFLAEHSDERIVIYGLGEYTKHVLKENSGNIVGLGDAKSVGASFFGYTVLSLQEIKCKASLVLILAGVKSIPFIYERIKECCEHIRVYAFNGENIKEYSDLYSNISYRDMSEAAIKERIDGHEVISFDIFDTLLIREALYPTDLFAEVELRLADELMTIPEYSIKRIAAEKKAREHMCEPDIDMIYDELQKITGISSDLLSFAKATEFATEKKFLRRREDVYKLLLYAGEKEKKIVLTSDMYYSKKALKELLESKDIIGNFEIFVSTDYGVSKWPNGDLFEAMAQKMGVIPARILHIGDNEGADGDAATMKGMDSIVVWSPFEAFLHSEERSRIVTIDSHDERMLLGKYLSEKYSGIYYPCN